MVHRVARLAVRLAVISHHEGAQALVILAARRASIEVGAQAGKVRVGIGPCELEVDVLVEQLEALLAGHLESGRTEHSLESFVVPVV
jgi:hypothetical protein